MTARIALLALTLLGGCYYASSTQDVGAECGSGDPMDPARFAADPATGVCFEFADACDVPKEWPPCTPTYEACMVDADCGANRGCVNGECVERGIMGCMGDDSCPLTQHCDAAAATCIDNDGCTMDMECPDGQFCDMVTVGGGDCDPNTPGCEMPMGVGLCSRQPAPPPPGCTTNADCSRDQICPAQYGGCSFDERPPADGTLCPSLCEQACYDDTGCPDDGMAGTRCNAQEVCGMPGNGNDPGMPSDPLPCAGWCVSAM
jgi:hypothetical protein